METTTASAAVEPSPRWARVEQVSAEYPRGSQAWSLDDAGEYRGPGEPLGAPSRFALVEHSVYGGHWITTHDSPADASAYQRGQEYREDWQPVTLVDLDGSDEAALDHVELPPTDEDAMDAIAALLSGQEWSSDTAPAIAAIVASTGRAIDDTDDTEGA